MPANIMADMSQLSRLVMHKSFKVWPSLSCPAPQRILSVYGPIEGSCGTVLSALKAPLSPALASCPERLHRGIQSQSPQLQTSATSVSAGDSIIDNYHPAEPLPNAEKRLMLIDAHALMFRFHHAYGKLLQSEAGEQTSISFGVMRTLLDMLEVNPPPSHLAIVMDAPGKTFRHELFKEYKAQRPPFPQEIKVAIPQLTALLKALRIPLIREPGVEADDVIGTLALRAVDEGFQVAIVSPDKDFFQLLRPGLSLLRTPKKDMPRSQLYGGQRLFTSLDFQDEVGLRPDQWRDALALMGDSADNVPGVAGIGGKGAVDLLQQFQTLENMLDKASEIKKKRQREALISEEGAAVAKFSQTLVTINTNLTVPSVTGPLSELRMLPLTEADKGTALQQLNSIGFKEHTKRWKRIWATQEQEAY